MCKLLIVALVFIIVMFGQEHKEVLKIVGNAVNQKIVNKEKITRNILMMQALNHESLKRRSS